MQKQKVKEITEEQNYNMIDGRKNNGYKAPSATNSMRNGNWYCGGYFVLQTAFNNKKLRELGYLTFTEFYLKVCEN